MFDILFKKLNRFYEKLFFSYGKFVGRHYIIVMCVAFLINCIISSGIMKMTLENDKDKLFTTVNSRAVSDHKRINELFNSKTLNSNNFFMHQLTTMGTWGEINFVTCPNEKGMGNNILTKEYIQKIQKVHEFLLDETIVTFENKTFGYKEICAVQNGKCIIEGESLLKPHFYDKTLKVFMKQKEKIEKENELLEPQIKKANDFSFYMNGYTVTYLTYTLGKYFEVNLPKDSKNGTEPAYSNFLKLRYNLRADKVADDKMVELWELEYLKNAKLIESKFPELGCDDSSIGMRVSFAVSSSIDIELEANLELDTNLISLTFILIFIIATILMSVDTNWVTAPGMLLPSAGIYSALFGITSSYGLLSWFGYEACNLVFMIPFLVIGVGIDDMFIIYSAFVHSTKGMTTSSKAKNMDISEILGKTLRKSGVSITITSFTDFAAFMIGILADFRSVQIFCVYAGFAIIFCYFYQLTIFCGFLCFHASRIKNGRNTFLPCVKQTSITCCASEDYHTNAIDEKFACEGIEMLKNEEKANKVSNHKNKDRSCFGSFKRFFKKVLKFLITDKWGKFVTILIFVLYLSVSIWKGSQVKEGMKINDLVSYESHYYPYMNDNTDLINLNPIVMLVIDQPIDYENITNRNEINRIIEESISIDSLSDTFNLNWLSQYDDEERIEYGNNPEEFLEDLEYFPPFQNDVVIAENSNGKHEIVASRFYVQYSVSIFGAEDAIPMNKLRKICDESFLPIKAFSMAFQFFEQFEATVPNIQKSFLTSSIVMFFIAFIFIPDFVSIFCILISMFSIMIGLLGAMQFWALRLSTITMVIIILAIGFCIDFSAHIVHAFIADVGTGNRDERAYKACIRVGIPIFNSAFSTFIGISLLYFCQSFIFETFFKTLTILMVLGILHSLLFLPVLLSFIGPNWKVHKKDNKIPL